MPLPTRRNLFDPLPASEPDEAVTPLIDRPDLVLERIVSRGHVTRPDAWYDQSRPEWVILLQGRATLRFADTDEPMVLSPGDYLLIPAHCRHRVESTSTDPPCLWLALHFHEQDPDRLAK